MLIDTLKAKNRLVSEYGFSEQHAEGVVETVASAEERVATKADLQRWAFRIILANAAVMALLLALFEFVT